MSRSRLEQLNEYYDQDPNDPFNVYALALEYLKTDLVKARSLFELLLSDHEDYLPVYYHAAKLYEALGEKQNAIVTYEKGMRVARNKQEAKALRELQSAYDELMFE